MARKDSLFAFVITACIVAGVALMVFLITLTQQRAEQAARKEEMRAKRDARQEFRELTSQLEREFRRPHTTPAPQDSARRPELPQQSSSLREQETSVSPITENEVRKSASPWREVTLKGRALDEEGNPVDGIKIGLDMESGQLPDAEATTSDHGGHFVLSFRARPEWTSFFLNSSKLRFGVRDSSHVLLMSTRISAQSLDHDHRVILARSRSLSGRVMTPQGEGISQARISLRFPRAAMEAWPMWSPEMDMGTSSTARGHSREVGQFILPLIPDLEGAILRVDHESWDTSHFPLPYPYPPELALSLREGNSHRIWIRGSVKDERGDPVFEANIEAGNYQGQTDEAGQFEIPADWREIAYETFIVAHKPGYQTTRSQSPLGESLQSLLHEQIPLPSFALVCASPASSIQARVEDVEGNPVPHIQVEVFHAKDSSTVLARCVSDQQGSIEVQGLAPGDYHLRAYDPKTGRTSSQEAKFTAPTEGHRLILQGPEIGPFRGRLRDQDGNPVGFAKIQVFFPANAPVPTLLSELVSQSDGSFSLYELPRAPVRLEITHPGILPHSQRVQAGDFEPSVSLDLERAAFVQIEIEDSSDDFSLIAWDQEDQAMPLWPRTRHGIVQWTHSFQGASDVLTVSEKVRILELRRGPQILERIPIKPMAGQLLILKRKNL